MSSYAVVKRYEEKRDPSTGKQEQTRGFIKLLSCIQNYEDALEEFETYIELGWRRCLEEIEGMQPTTWEKLKGVDMKQKFLLENKEAFGFYVLDEMVKQKSYRGNLNDWKQFERYVGVDIARYYVNYSHLRNLIRVGLVVHLDAPMCKFVNVWGNRYSCFR